MKQVERVPMTRPGYEKLKAELDQLKSVERPRLVKEIEEARAHGDLSENAEYHAAREKMGHVKGRMIDLESRLSRAEIIDPRTLSGTDRVMFGAHVTLLDTEEEKEMTYQIVGEFESDVNAGKISVTSPVAKAIIGKMRESVISVRTPKGLKEFEIVQIEYK